MVKTLVNVVNYSILISVFLLLAFHTSHGISLAQGKPPGVDLKIYIVPERVVCPDGYISYEDEGASNCPKLRMHDIDIIALKCEKAYQLWNIPPTKVKLADNLFHALDNYRAFAGKTNDPDKRKSLVFVFEFTSVPENSMVSLRRESNPNKTNIPGKKWSDKLVGNHYIHHERADALDPGQKIEWELKMGDHTWTFFATR